MKVSDRIATKLTHDRSGGYISIVKSDGTGGWIEQVISTSDLLSGGGTPCTLLQNVTGNVSCSFPAINWIDSIFIKTISGTPTIQIGTTLAGSDILPTTPVNDFLYEKTEYPFKTDGALYFVITGGNVNIRINNIPNLI